MRKELIGAASALALMTGAAFAQGNSMTDPTTSNPATPPSAMESAPAPANSPAMSEGGATGSAASAASVEGLMGKNVVGSDGEKLGSVEDVIVDPASGEAKQLVISSGGFLGIGAKQIAVDFSQAQVGMDDDGDDPEIKLNGITQADVEGMPEFEYSDTMTSLSRGTDTGATGGTSGTMTRPSGSTGGTGCRDAVTACQVIKSQGRPGDRQPLRANLGTPGASPGGFHVRGGHSNLCEIARSWPKGGAPGGRVRGPARRMPSRPKRSRIDFGQPGFRLGVALGGEAAGGGEPSGVLVQGFDQVRDTLPLLNRQAEDRDGPVAARGFGEAEGAFDVGAGALGGGAEVRFGHDDDVGDFDDAGFHELQAVAGTGLDAEHDGIRRAGDVRFGLADADGFDQDDIVDGPHQDHRRDRQSGQAAQAVAGRHGADEAAGVFRVGGEAGAVAQQGAAAPA